MRSYPAVPGPVLLAINYDQRIRHMGFDIVIMMQAAGMNADQVDAPVVSSVIAAESGERPS